METGLTRHDTSTATFKQRAARDVATLPASETVTESSGSAVQCKARRCYGELILLTEK